MSLCPTPYNELRYVWPEPKKTHLFQKLYRIEVGKRNERKEAMLSGSYKVRSHKYESGQFEFDLTTCEAWSYGWWQFVQRVGNTIYFNDSSYSSQTDLHQAMAKNILLCEAPEEFGLRVKYVYVREGLNNMNRAIENQKYEIRKLEEKISNPRSQKKLLKYRLSELKRLKRKLLDLYKLQLELNGAK